MPSNDHRKARAGSATVPDSELPYSLTLEVRDACFCLHLRRAARLVARRYDEALRPLNLTNGQFSLLMSLNRPQPPGMAAVAEVLGMDRTTLTANLKPLERRGLVTVTPDPDDKRSRRLALTAEGRALLARAVPIWRATQVEVEKLIASTDPESWRADLRAMS